MYKSYINKRETKDFYQNYLMKQIKDTTLQMESLNMKNIEYATKRTINH